MADYVIICITGVGEESAQTIGNGFVHPADNIIICIMGLGSDWRQIGYGYRMACRYVPSTRHGLKRPGDAYWHNRDTQLLAEDGECALEGAGRRCPRACALREYHDTLLLAQHCRKFHYACLQGLTLHDDDIMARGEMTEEGIADMVLCGVEIVIVNTLRGDSCHCHGAVKDTLMVGGEYDWP